MPVTVTPKKCSRSRGLAMMELVLFAPWFLFLFVAALDWGFYAAALVSLQAGVRSAALYASSSTAASTDSDTACGIVLGEMRKLPNIGSGVAACGSNPIVTVTPITGPDAVRAAQVSVTYQSISLIPVPGLLAKQFTITRVVKMRVRS